jgi:hypothetical protein
MLPPLLLLLLLELECCPESDRKGRYVLLLSIQAQASKVANGQDAEGSQAMSESFLKYIYGINISI